MEWKLFLPLPLFLLSICSGFIFGFLLRKGNVVRFDVIVRQLLLKDFTVMRVILTAIFVGSLAIYSLDSLGMVPQFRLTKIPLLYSALGGGIFAIGMSLSGYCPGTMVAAVADGAKDMIWGVVGMLAGAALYNKASVYLHTFTDTHDAFYQQTLHSYLGVSPFLIVAIMGAFWLVLFTRPLAEPGLR